VPSVVAVIKNFLLSMHAKHLEATKMPTKIAGIENRDLG
jgi:hypothetical protein